MIEKNYENFIPINSWAEEDRPREKLILKGRKSLTTAELIAILIGTGTRKESAVDVAKKLLAQAENNLNLLGRQTIKELCRINGIGEAKAISIMAALELGQRRQIADVLERKQISSSADGFRFFQPIIGDLPHEEFWILLLNRHNKIIGHQRISQGGVAGTVADLKIIFKSALDILASSIIAAHNHPSGNLRPSQADKNLTTKMVEAGKIIDIQVLDHLIVTSGGYYSFADEGMI